MNLKTHLGGTSRTWHLRSVVGKIDGATTHQLYVGVNYFSSTRRKIFNWASDDTATPLAVKAIASEADHEIAAKTGLHKGPGIVVFEVAPGSIAERSGLKVLDRIMAVAGCGPSVDSQAAMKKCIANKKAYVGMVVDRGGDLTTVGMRLYAEGR